MRKDIQYAIRRTPYAKGITLVEMIIVIVILGLAIPVLLRSWADTAWRSTRSEAIADANFYAEELMELVKSKQFDQKISAPWTHSDPTKTPHFGVDAGECSDHMLPGGGCTGYNDVDDFVGSTDPQVTSAGSFNRSVTVDYVYLNGTTWTGCPPTTCVAVTDCTACVQCCYKRITVTVSHKNNLIPPVTLTTIVHQ